MSFYSDLAQIAVDMLTEFGQNVTVTKFAIGLTDPSTGLSVTDSSTTTEKGVLLDFEYRSFGDSLRASTATLGSNKRLLMTATTFVEAGDKVIVDGDLYKIVVAKLVNPSGIKVIYDCWIER